jgi:hypothetical protein
MSRLERIQRAGYQVIVQWECDFKAPKDVRTEEEHLPLRTKEALYGGRTEVMRLHHRVKEGEETIQYVDVMSLFPWVCKYFNFHVGRPTIHLECGDVENHARERRTSAMHGDATQGTVTTGAAIQVQRPPIMLFV